MVVVNIGILHVRLEETSALCEGPMYRSIASLTYGRW